MEELESSFGVSGHWMRRVRNSTRVSFASWKEAIEKKKKAARENNFILQDVVEAVKGELLVKRFSSRIERGFH